MITDVVVYSSELDTITVNIVVTVGCPRGPLLLLLDRVAFTILSRRGLHTLPGRGGEHAEDDAERVHVHRGESAWDVMDQAVNECSSGGR